MRDRWRIAAFVASWSIASLAAAAGQRFAYDVELPDPLKRLANHGRPGPVTRAAITIVAPDDADGTTPVLVISATADVGAQSSRRLLDAYADTAVAAGWMVVAADPDEVVPREDDDVSLRIALDAAALAVLDHERPSPDGRPLAFGGISGGAKFAGWLAAAFVHQGRPVVGVYQAGINEDTLVDAATRFDVLDASFRELRVYLQSGRLDDVATPVDHRAVAERLKRAGFRNVRVVYVAGGHTVDPGPLRDALSWFREPAAAAH